MSSFSKSSGLLATGLSSLRSRTNQPIRIRFIPMSVKTDQTKHDNDPGKDYRPEHHAQTTSEDGSRKHGVDGMSAKQNLDPEKEPSRSTGIKSTSTSGIKAGQGQQSDGDGGRMEGRTYDERGRGPLNEGEPGEVEEEEKRMGKKGNEQL